jgi:hypothetical protein
VGEDGVILHTTNGGTTGRRHPWRTIFCPPLSFRTPPTAGGGAERQDSGRGGQRDDHLKPSLSKSKLRRGTRVSDTVTHQAHCRHLGGTIQLYLYHWESKLVTKIVGGKNKRSGSVLASGARS